MENERIEELKNGAVYLIDKPLDWTSFDVVKKIKFALKRQLGIKKIKVGHAGTLDPRATGLLIVCVGRATKQIPEIQNQKKVYTGIIKLGATTPSYDTETEEENIKEYHHLSNRELRTVEEAFLGEVVQTPPIFSAVKKEGVRAYELARKGEAVKLSPRTICIDYLKFTDIDLPFVAFEVQCSKGTYIRSLANDIGEKLGVGAYLYSLRREKIGDYSVEHSTNEVLFDKSFFQT